MLTGIFLLTFGAVSQETTISSKKSEMGLNDSSIVYVSSEFNISENVTTKKDSVVSETKEEKTQNKKSWRGGCTWYGASHHGNKTASGARFNMHALTAASPEFSPTGIKLKFGSKVKITNKDNGKSVIVTITDRGGFAKKHPTYMDLSLGAFEKLASKKKGRLTNVRFELL